MINLKKVMCLTVASIMVATIGIGCGSPKVKPEEVTKIALDVELKGDKSQIDKINMNEDEFNSKRDKAEKTLTNALGGTSLNLSDEDMGNFKDSILEGLGKVTYEVGEAKVDKDSATVTVNINGIDMNDVLNKAQDTLKEEMVKDPSAFATQDSIMKKSFEVVGNAVKDPALVSEGANVDVKLTKKDNVWVLVDPDLTDVMIEAYKM